jgi:alkanesulfonate monooxygenase SsuD/methylene tetrahydromethanopterin reductase-like flavin-dependent oxidoreductase (luciferase family)
MATTCSWRKRSASPKPLQGPPPPILIGGRSQPLLRVDAEHADIWNVPGGDLKDCVEASATLDRFCTELGRDPGAITRSIHVGVLRYHELGTTRDAIEQATNAGFRDVVLSLPAPYPESAAQWVVDELIAR